QQCLRPSLPSLSAPLQKLIRTLLPSNQNWLLEHFPTGLGRTQWISTTYTLLLLRHLGLPPASAQAQQGAFLLLEKGFYRDGGINLFKSFQHSETCVTGMTLALLCYFHLSDDGRIHRIVEHLLGQQMADGGWNCERPKGATHGSFHTTISVLEGLHEYSLTFSDRATALAPAIAAAHEFLLLHRLYHSHRTGQVADPAMARIYFPPRWHYDFLRVLDYFQWLETPPDERMSDAIDLLRSKRLAAGRWKQGQNWAGRVFFEMEPVGQPGRWNTLRALRVLRWWEGGHTSRAPRSPVAASGRRPPP
ncbi:MAG: hypothetical protein K1X65_20245, partial [Caldilineales bacterium]|nr:hypothetical protein [Caldilineales bacterium]